ncbi:MAG: family 78 glycoside hydrolase catalytic domain, partial [Candidatus Sumerlaeota bacterium]|nr:family 78 glycoside hydrolase catalytic domain [Candidatus Sumerlaeota bacterium]
YYYFRKEFTLNAPPKGLRVYVAADTRYQLFLNGRFVGRGAPQSQPFFQYYDERPVDAFLKKGRNCVAFIVNYVGNHEDTRGGLLAELCDRAGRTILATGRDWRVARAAAWREDTFYCRFNKTTPYQEFYDARKAPAGWNQVGFHEAGWTPVVVARGPHSDNPPAVPPWYRLLPRDIPDMASEAIAPRQIVAVEENLDLANRMRGDDLSIALSMPGGPLRYSRAENVDRLCGAKNDGAILQCSTNHLRDIAFDGIYDPSVVLDFGRVLSAYIQLEIDGVNGGMIDIGYAERLVDGHFNNALECQFADRYTMVDGEQAWQSFTWKSFRYVKIRFHSCPKPVRLRSVRAVTSNYPYENRGAFQSDDEKFNAIFELSRATLRLCSNEFLMDTPWREQAQWLGDVAAVTVPAVYACFGDTALPGKFYRQSAANQFPTGIIPNVSNTVSKSWMAVIPDYSLWWIMGVWNHYLYTGEERWIHQLYPEACRVIRAHLHYVNEHGLVEDMPYHPFIDWAWVDRAGECGAYNAIFFGALEAFAAMARLKNDAYMTGLAESTMANIQANLQKRLFDRKRGVFADANLRGRFSPRVSEQGNFAPIRWGLCDPKTAARVISAFYEKKTVKNYVEAQPFFMIVVLQALERAGRFDLALELIRDRWGGRMVDRGHTTAIEEWYVNGTRRSGPLTGLLRSHSHAWSACPAEFLIRNLMGLEILAPGCRKVRVSPREAPFNYSVAYPTPLGVIRVSRENGRARIAAPKGVKVVS